jgi:phosphatidylglycerol:prolipoprotein diacylglycerol transferase
MFSLFPSRTVAFEIMGFGVHWYGLLYFASFLIGWWMLPRIQKYRGLDLSMNEWSDLLAAAVLGVIIGGRLGYVFFYGFSYYLSHPLEVFEVWKGGMASHGGFIGVTVALLWTLRRRSRETVLKIADLVVIPVTIGLGLGRLGNFINQELYGTVTTLPWGMQFPGAQGLRHPIQLYDFGLQMLIAAILFWYVRSTSDVTLSGDEGRHRHSWFVSAHHDMIPGRTCALFLLLYGTARFLLEFIREQNGVYFYGLSEGQWLTIPLLVFGIGLWFIRLRSLDAIRDEKFSR